LGYFITFEGIEGCGKTTQIMLLCERLQALGHAVVLTREPGGCPIADKVRTILLDADNHSMYPLAELLLYAAARAQHVAEVIRPAMDKDSIVLCDRFTDATFAYQSAGRGIDRITIDTLNHLACQSIIPDFTVLIDCDVKVGLDRARRRIDGSSGPREERFELEALAFHQRVRDGYLGLVSKEPKRIFRVDGNASVETISNVILERLLAQLK
jgi:dTMP kinase